MWYPWRFLMWWFQCRWPLWLFRTKFSVLMEMKCPCFASSSTRSCWPVCYWEGRKLIPIVIGLIFLGSLKMVYNYYGRLCIHVSLTFTSRQIPNKNLEHLLTIQVPGYLYYLSTKLFFVLHFWKIQWAPFFPIHWIYEIIRKLCIN